MKNKGLRLSSIVIVAGVISACNSSGFLLSLTKPRVKSQSIDTYVSDYSKASCEFSAEQGDVAASTLPVADIQTTYFGKKYDQNLLKAVLSASAKETIRFANLTNVDFYSVLRYKSDSCLLTDFLPAATSYYQEQFNKLGKGVLGLYLPPRNALLEKGNQNAVIMVRRDANRWVLVHEFMHHLFSKEIHQSDLSDEELKDKLRSVKDAHKNWSESYKRSKSIDDGRALLQATKNLVILEPELLRRFTLEEMAIESLLADKLQSGEYRNVPLNQAINGAAYVYTSAENADLRLLLLSVDALLAESTVISMDSKLADEERKEFLQAFKDAQEKIKGYRDELKILKERAVKTLKQNGINPDTDLTGFLEVYAANGDARRTDHRHVGCAHSSQF